MKYFDRDYIAKVFNNHISFLYLLFINNFNIYQNIYRTLKIFYFILIYLSYKEKRKIINIFILILESYKANFINVIKAFRKLIR